MYLRCLLTTQQSSTMYTVLTVELALIRKCRTTEFCWYYYVLNCEFVWTTRVLLSLPGNILTRVRTAARNVVFISLFVCVCDLPSHQAVPPSRSSCTPPRNPPTVALFPLSTPAPCWTETWGEFHVCSLLPGGGSTLLLPVTVCVNAVIGVQSHINFS